MKATGMRRNLIISAAVMLALALGLAYFSTSVYAAEVGKYDAPVEIAFTVSTTEDIDISATGAEAYGVRAAYKAFDEAGNFVAYVVESSEIGFNAQVPIVIASTITADGKVLAGIKVLEQDETEYFGARIPTSVYTDRFTGKMLPVVLTGEAGRGAHVDALSKSTISSRAVMKAVNSAYEFVNAELVDGQ